MKDWLRENRLTDHKSSPQEIADLLGVIDRDLSACRTRGLVPDWQFSIAYNAALQAAHAALAASGYRTSGIGQHHTAIQSLAYTVRLDPKLVTKSDRFRKRRNMTGYDCADVVSDQEVREMMELAEELRRILGSWLRANHPALLRR